MNGDMQTKVFQLLDVIAVEVAAHRVETAKQNVDLRTEMHSGFNRIDHRLGSLETRVENIETRVENIETRVENIETRVENIETRVENTETNVVSLGAELRSFRGEFERRITPLER
jgi:archaellum component FlaC